MFTESADFYDLIYSIKDYRREAGLLRDRIRTEHPAGKTILDVACGTGELHSYLTDEYEVDGLDINETFLKAARRKHPGGNYFQADMTDFDLGKQYDIITCLFSSIGYLKTLPQLKATLECFVRHLRPEGILIVEPWLTPDSYQSGKVHLITYERDDIKICRMNRSDVKGDLSVIHFHYLLGTPAEGVRHFEELHELRMTTVREMEAAFANAGLSVCYDQEGLMGRGLYVGKKRT